jgi:glyoxylase-like metal-dependent hydrolase (beta-lactamase superfamily II)
MVQTTDFQCVATTLFVWEAFDPESKTDLWSSAFALGGATYLIDPIDLEPQACARMLGNREVAGIFLTNANHERAAAAFSNRYCAPIFARRDAAPPRWPRFQDLDAVPPPDPAIRFILIEGAAAGEAAIFLPGSPGTLIVGDALINFEPHDFSLLPPKYCRDPRQMRKSLGQLLALDFDRMLFAHGSPILSGAKPRLERLLEGALR